MDTKSTGPGPLVWVVAFVAIAALAFFGWRSNRPPVAVPVQAPAAAPAKREAPKPEAPVVTETNGGLPG